jgi:hypothetical protein
MTTVAGNERRTLAFRRNPSLEEFLRKVNDLLACSEQTALEQYSKGPGDYPVIFLTGPLRSGTTLFIQWLASMGLVAYPTNLLSRFFGAPIVGAHVQLLLTDSRYNFRNEIRDFNAPISFESENGKTTGALAPNEFWYFWRRFLPFNDLDWLPDEELLRVVDRKNLVGELTALTRVFAKPFALKAMILNYNVAFLDAIFEKALFIQIKRDPVTNVASILDARRRQLGSDKEWYSFRIPEYPLLKNLPPVAQAAGQVHYINRAITQGLAKVANSRKLLVTYEEFCEDPRAILDRLLEKLGIRDKTAFQTPERFRVSRDVNPAERVAIDNALAEFEQLSA